MMATDLLRIVLPTGVSFRWPSPCRRASRPRASAPGAAHPPAPLSRARASCLERARLMPVAAFLGTLIASSAAPPGRRRPEQQRTAKAEGKIKGSGTVGRLKPCLHAGRDGTRARRRRAVGNPRFVS
jgi:hypothetical protein